MNPQQPTYPIPTQASSKKGLLVNVVLGVLLVAAIGFGVMEYAGKQSSQTSINKQIDAAVVAAKTAQAASLQAAFDTQSKSPSKTYTGSATYGSITFNYPKTWSAYIDTSNSSEPINAYFNPDYVPGIQGTTNYALRVELVDTNYSDVISQIQGGVSDGSLKASAYVPPKLSGVANVQTGTKFDGPLTNGSKVSGSMVVMKVRDKTLKVYTMSTDYSADFTGTVLASLSFAP